ncbi:uncharacterized protein V1513DRAFT_435051 [Lipomyces chichibuensis]|uniref:uncharacterized protein n=1 Tax=Lipomyces chichibuensis TaxID=1546026 RepID=UPI003343F85C
MSSHQTGGEQTAADFGSYIDFSDLQLDLSAFDIEAAGNILDFDRQHAQHQQNEQQQHHLQHPQQQQQQLQHSQQQRRQLQPHDHPIYEEQAQHQQKQHLHEDLLSSRVASGNVSSASNSTVSSGVIPPTPSSLDFVGGASNPDVFRSPSGLIDPYSMRDEMMFTPLLSPAVTPLENPMSMPKEYGYPSSYFSPLTSPALEAQSYPFHTSTSPPGSDNNSNGLTKVRRRGTGGYAPPSAASSPAQAVTRITKSDSAAQRSSKRRATAAFSQPNTMGDVSSSESISPEPLLTLPESSMAPPPIPPFKNTTAVRQETSSPLTQRRLSPVTPASLMNLNKERVNNTVDILPTRDADAIIEGVVRRHSAVATVTPAPITESGSVGSSSANSSPALRPMPRGLVRSASVGIEDNSAKALPRTIKPVRSRSGSVSMSPTIKPRISPNLKPLLPDGLEAASALLASKSNYQNIVEGKHSQLGLSYPEQLSINLTSKRTSHKIAEQGRRNRINNALAELNQLLIDNINLPISDDEGEKNELPQQCSKANTVELAIDYIKKLQARVCRLKTRLKDTEGELQAEREKNGTIDAAADTVANVKSTESSDAMDVDVLAETDTKVEREV